MPKHTGPSPAEEGTWDQTRPRSASLPQVPVAAADGREGGRGAGPEVSLGWFRKQRFWGPGGGARPDPACKAQLRFPGGRGAASRGGGARSPQILLPQGAPRARVRPAWSPPGDACPAPFTVRLLEAGPVIRASGLPSGHRSGVCSRVGTRGVREAELEGAWRPRPPRALPRAGVYREARG